MLASLERPAFFRLSLGARVGGVLVDIGLTGLLLGGVGRSLSIDSCAELDALAIVVDRLSGTVPLPRCSKSPSAFDILSDSGMATMARHSHSMGSKLSRGAHSPPVHVSAGGQCRTHNTSPATHLALTYNSPITHLQFTYNSPITCL